MLYHSCKQQVALKTWNATGPGTRPDRQTRPLDASIQLGRRSDCDRKVVVFGGRATPDFGSAHATMRIHHILHRRDLAARSGYLRSDF
jgi:hypothetical protein